MAIDSATKRQSANSFNQVYMPLNQTDGTIDQGDRQTASFSYSGISAQTLTPATGRSDQPRIWLYLDD